MCEALPPTLKKKTKIERREQQTDFIFPSTEVIIRATQVSTPSRTIAMGGAWRTRYRQIARCQKSCERGTLRPDSTLATRPRLSGHCVAGRHGGFIER